MNITTWEEWLRPTIQNNVNLVKEHIEYGSTFIDVGANTGLFTQMLIDDLGIDHFNKIVLFEPVSYLASECINKFSKYSNVQVEEIALGDSNCKTTILASSINLGYNKIYSPGMEIHPHEKIEINCIKFDSWIKNNKLNDVDFIKIDAEGYDTNIILGMMSWLSSLKKRPKILFEINWYPDIETNVINIMNTELNYKIIKFDSDVLLIP